MNIMTKDKREVLFGEVLKYATGNIKEAHRNGTSA